MASKPMSPCRAEETRMERDNDPHRSEKARRRALKALGAIGTAAAASHPALQALAATAARGVLPFDNGERELVVFPQKRPLMLLTSRPPQLETPFAVFNEGVLTPNDSFFVRYNWSCISSSIEPARSRLRWRGEDTAPYVLT